MSDAQDPAEHGYKISSFSGGGNCVEVKQTPSNGSVTVRNTRRRDQLPMVFTAAEWAAFVLGVKNGEFDPV